MSDNRRGEAQQQPRRWWMASLIVALTTVLAGCTLSLGSANTGPGTAIPIKVLHGADNSTLAEVSVYIGGHGPYPFIVDTGASISLIAAPLAQRLQLPRSGQRQPISGVAGTEQIVFVQMSQWKVGNVALPSMSVGSGRLIGDRQSGGMQGLLGSDIWSQFGKITLDYNAQILTVYGQVADRAGKRRMALASPLGSLVGHSV